MKTETKRLAIRKDKDSAAVLYIVNKQSNSVYATVTLSIEKASLSVKPSILRTNFMNEISDLFLEIEEFHNSQLKAHRGNMKKHLSRTL